MLGKTGGRRRRGRQRMRWLDGITNSMDEFAQISGYSGGQGSMVYCSPWGLKESDATGQLNNSNMCVLELWFSQGMCPVVGFLGHMIDLFLVF